MELEQTDHNKLQQTVIQILKSADFDVDTELSVRIQAGKLLGLDLSDLNSKQTVRQIVESFLLSTSSIDDAPEVNVTVEEVQTEKLSVDDRNIASDDCGERLICTVSCWKPPNVLIL